MTAVRTFAESNIGLVRKENEDSFLLHIPEDEDTLLRKGILAVVADGVGGGPAGKKASSMAVEIIDNIYFNSGNDNNLRALSESVQAANLGIYNASRLEPILRGMATTCTAAALVNGEAIICHVGDSRIYVLHGREFNQISEDHTLVNELVNEGIISRGEARTHPQRNIILKSLGSTPSVEPDSHRVKLEIEDILLLCSDGLHGYASDDEISSILLSCPVEEAGRRLIKLVLEKGAPDNVTVLILQRT